ncbi:recombinase family protein [Fictibacillus fluitans]
MKEDDTPAVVRRIFQDYLSGNGMDSIAKSLTKEGIPTPSQVVSSTGS